MERELLRHMKEIPTRSLSNITYYTDARKKRQKPEYLKVAVDVASGSKQGGIQPSSAIQVDRLRLFIFLLITAAQVILCIYFP
jgi:hypothetical protein